MKERTKGRPRPGPSRIVSSKSCRAVSMGRIDEECHCEFEDSPAGKGMQPGGLPEEQEICPCSFRQDSIYGVLVIIIARNGSSIMIQLTFFGPTMVSDSPYHCSKVILETS